MATVAYLRVSTEGQDLDKNKIEILKLAHEKKLGQVEFVEEKVSGKISWKKRKIADIIESLGNGDAILLPEISRLGRSMLEIMEILSIAAQKQIHVYSVKGNWTLDNTIQSKIIAFAFTMAAEIERELISSRTKEALAAKKAAGVKLGRPKGIGRSKLDEKRLEIEALLTNGSTKRFIAKRYGVSEAGLHHFLKKHGIS